MIGGGLLLAMAIFGLQVLFGKKPDDYYRFLVWLIFAPILFAIGCNHLVWVWFDLPLWMRIFSVLLIPFLVSLVFRLMFPKAKWFQVLQTAFFQVLIFAATFPFRFLWRASQFFVQRERRSQRLDPYRPVVGGRPPLRNERREIN